jgi:hypothetical protein
VTHRGRRRAQLCAIPRTPSPGRFTQAVQRPPQG